MFFGCRSEVVLGKDISSTHSLNPSDSDMKTMQILENNNEKILESKIPVPNIEPILRANMESENQVKTDPNSDGKFC